MSANNFIQIKEYKDHFKVMMLDAEMSVQLGKYKKFKTLREAVERAQAILDWEEVEYGIHFELLPKKEIG